jgi:hypothetical protein
MSVQSQTPAERSVDRARAYTVVGVLMAIGSVYFLFGNVFLVPVCGLVAIFCAWRGWKNGAPGPLMLLIFAVGGLAALIAGVALVLLLPNLPTLKFGDVHYEHT